MKMYKTKTWQYEVTGTAENVKLFGIPIFDYPWESAGKRAKIHRLSGETGSYAVKKLTMGDKSYEFVAIETSNGVWEFYTYRY